MRAPITLFLLPSYPWIVHCFKVGLQPNRIQLNKLAHVSLNDIIRESKIKRNYSYAIEVADKLTQNLSELSPTEITGVLQIYGESNRLGDALAVCRDLEKLNILPNAYHLSVLIKACRKAGQWELAMGLYERRTQYNISSVDDIAAVSNSLLATLLDCKQFSLVNDLFNQMRSTCVLSTYTYAMMISALDKQGRLSDSVELYNSMFTSPTGIPPNTVCLNNALSSCLNHGQFQSAIDLFTRDCLVQRKVRPDAATCSVIIAAYGVLGDFQNAWRLFHAMDDMNKLSTHTFVYKPGNSKRSTSTGSSIRSESITGSQFESVRICRDTGVYNAMLGACQKTGRWRESVVLLGRMGRHSRDSAIERVFPDSRSFSSAISCCGAAFRWREVMQIFNSIELEGVAKDQVIYYNVISALQSAANRAITRELSQKSKPISTAFSVPTDVDSSDFDVVMASHSDDAAIEDSEDDPLSDVTSSHLQSLLQDVYAEAISSGMLIDRRTGNSPLPYDTLGLGLATGTDKAGVSVYYPGLVTVDLHGYPALVAQATVDWTLRQARANYTVAMEGGNEFYHEVELTLNDKHPINQPNYNCSTLLFITGRGRHANSRGCHGVLRQEVQEHLRRQYPSLKLTFSSNNDGCIIVTSSALNDWLKSN